MHPSDNELRKFISGKLHGGKISEIEQHLECCGECCKKVASVLDDDSLSRALRHNYVEGRSDVTQTKNADDSTQPGRSESKNPKHCNLPSENTIFHHFQLLREIGRGGFGTVWLAKDTKNDRPVALKIPNLGRFANRQQRKRFFNEAAAASTLDHPNIVRVFEAGEHEGMCYVASEYCDGVDLEKWLRASDTPVHSKTAAMITEKIAGAVAHAHENGVLHRDLKPGNIFLDPRNRRDNDDSMPQLWCEPKVGDFGMAKILKSNEDDTASNSVIGTIPYMSPEQANGQPASAHTDVYAIGAILYRVLSGQTPHTGASDLEVLKKIQNEPLDSPRAYRRDIPPDLEAICLKSLSRRPADRYTNAGELHKDLQRYLKHFPIRARERSLARHGVRWYQNGVRRYLNRRVTRHLFLSALLVFAFVLVFAFIARSQSWFKNQSQPLAHVEDEESTDNELRHALYQTLFSEVKLGSQGKHQGRRAAGIRAAKNAAELLEELKLGLESTVDLRNEAIACLGQLDLTLENQWAQKGDLDQPSGIAFSPDSTVYACWEHGGNIAIRDIQNNSLVSSIEVAVDTRANQSINPMLRFCPNGRFLVSIPSVGRTCFVWDLAEDNKLVYGENGEKREYKVVADFSIDGKRLAVAKPDGGISIVNLSDINEKKTIGTGSAIEGLSWNSDGSRIAVTRSDQMEILETDTGTLISSHSVQSGRLSICVYHPRHEFVAVVHDSVVRFFSVDSSKRELPLESITRITFPSQGGTVSGICFDPSGLLLAVSNVDGSSRLWNVQKGFRVLGLAGAVISFSDDGRFLTFGSMGPTLGRWRIEAPLRRNMIHHGPVTDIQLSGNGKCVLVAGPLSASTWGRDGELVNQIEKRGQYLSVWMPSTNNEVWSAGEKGLVKSNVKLLPRTDPKSNRRSNDAKFHIITSEAIPMVTAGRKAERIEASANERFVAIAGTNRGDVVEIYDRVTGQRRLTKTGKTECHHISSSGNLLAVCQKETKKCVVYQSKISRPIKTIGSNISSCRFSDDDRMLVVAEKDRFLVLETSDWQQVISFPRNPANPAPLARFCSQKKFLALTTDRNEISLYRIGTWEKLAVLRAGTQSNISAMDTVRNGELFAIGRNDGNVFLWEIQQIRSELKKLSLDWADN